MPDSEIESTTVQLSNHKKRLPLFMRLIISCIILVVSFSALKALFPGFADYVHQVVSFILALAGFIASSYKDYKNKIYNELHGKDDKK